MLSLSEAAAFSNTTILWIPEGHWRPMLDVGRVTRRNRHSQQHTNPTLIPEIFSGWPAHISVCFLKPIFAPAKTIDQHVNFSHILLGFGGLTETSKSTSASSFALDSWVWGDHQKIPWRLVYQVLHNKSNQTWPYHSTQYIRAEHGIAKQSI